MAKGDDIQERLVEFAVRIIKLCSSLPKTDAGRHIAGQLLRCGTSPAPNYGEARGAESGNDFVHKLGVVLKELNETAIWLEMIKRSDMVSPDADRTLAIECGRTCQDNQFQHTNSRKEAIIVNGERLTGC